MEAIYPIAIADMQDAWCIEMHRVAKAINYHAFDGKLFGESKLNGRRGKNEMGLYRGPLTPFVTVAFIVLMTDPVVLAKTFSKSLSN